MLGFLKKAFNTQVGPSYTDNVNTFINRIVETGNISLDNEGPFKLKKGELFIGSYDATLGVFKNNGNFAYGATTARIRIAKGLSFRLGAGKMGMEKSWVFDQPGTIHFTTQRMVFDGINTNTSVPYTKVIGLSLDASGKHLWVDRETGKDLCFKFDNQVPAEEMAKIHCFARGNVESLEKSK